MTYPASAVPEYPTAPFGPGYALAYVPTVSLSWLDQSNLTAGPGGTLVPACPGAPLPVQIIGGGAGGGTVAQGAAGSAAWPVADGNSAAWQGAVQLTPGSGTPATPGRGLGFICTAAGTLTLTLANSSTMAFPIAASANLQTLGFAVTGVALSGGAAGSFWNLV